MQSMMTASAVKRFSATCCTAVNEMLTGNGTSSPLPKTLLHVEHIRALAAIQPHTCPNAVVELADDGEHSRCYAESSEGSPQESAVDGVTGFGKVDKAHEQRGVLPHQFLQASHHEQHVDRRAVGSKSTLLLR